MVPKIIHYCWFGGNPLSELAENCIASWKKYCPDYKIIEWNEKNFNINYNKYVKEAYDNKKWAFVSDVVRLYALVEYGGVYMDTDVEVLKPLDCFLEYEGFSGFEAVDRISTCIMASEKNHRFIKELLHSYDTSSFVLEDGTLDTTTNVKRITDYCLQSGLQLNNTKQTICGYTLFPSEYFCPKDYKTLKTTITENTYTVHYFDGSWKNPEDVLSHNLAAKYGRFLPDGVSWYIARFCALVKVKGFANTGKELIHWLKKRR